MEKPNQQRNKEELQKKFSLEHRHAPPSLPMSRAPKRAITFLRFIIWISPGPTSLIALSLVYQYLMFSTIAMILCCILLSFFIGFCDSFLSERLPKRDGHPEWPAALRHSLLFALLQLIIAPTTVIVLGLGFCAVMVASHA